MDDHISGQASVGLVVGWGDPAVTGTASAGGFVLPTGMVAFLLTDVVASTRKWEAEPDAMAVAMERHDAILGAAISARGGVRPLAQGEGDSIVAAFSRASDAVLAAIEAQRALTAECWPTSTPLTVRMAIHAGEARTATDGNYAGQAIIRTARLRAISHGGQILVSEPARDLVVDRLGDKITLVDLGEHRLRDLARPEHVYQVTGAGLPDDFPPVLSLNAHRHNLPIQLSSFVGRLDEIATVMDLVRSHRLVTVVGAGGSGKTRLALQVAAELVADVKDGVWWVELADVRDPSLVVAAIASSIGVRGEIGSGAAEVLARVLEEQDMLLVLDNCEHLAEPVAAAAATLLRGCPAARVLATSRGPLELPGEVAWRIPPLRCPVIDGAAVPVTALSQFDSVRLFVDRAQHVRATFTTDATNAPAIAAICSRLDGVPLAIELAAARCRSMTPTQVLDGLNDAFRLLTGSARGVVPRQATLEASITWSHDLLSEQEKALLRRLSVFVGGCTLAAAEAVCSDDEIVPALTVLDLLDRLVTQSLVVLDDAPHPPRYRLLETVRQYAARRLDTAGETARVRDRHLAHYLEMCLTLRPTFEARLAGPPITRWALWWESDNVLAALDHATDERRWTDYALLAARAVDVLFEGNPDGSIALLDRVPGDDTVDRGLQAEVAWYLVAHLFERGDVRCVAELERAHALGKDGAHPVIAGMAKQMALLAGFDPVRAVAVLDELSADTRELTHPFVEMQRAFAGVMVRGVIQGDVAAARRYLEDFERLRAILPNYSAVLAVDMWAAVALQHIGDLGRATAYIDRAERWLSEHADPDREYSTVLFLPSQVAGIRDGLAALRGFPSPQVCVDAYKLAVRQGLNAAMLALSAGQGQLASGDAAGALVSFEDSFAQGTGFGTKIMIPPPATWAARALLALGDVDEARSRVAIADGIARTHGLTWALGLAMSVRAEIALVGDESEAWANALTALEFTSAHTFRLEQVDVLEVLTVLASRQGDHREVARLQGSIARVRDDLDYRLRLPAIAPHVQAALDGAKEALGAEAFDLAHEEGKRLNLEEVSAYALRSRGERSRSSTGWASLTPTERAVVDQVRLGLTNPQIAERLLMSRDTVKTHLSHIYTKLRVSNRTELTAQASRAT